MTPNSARLPYGNDLWFVQEIVIPSITITWILISVTMTRMIIIQITITRLRSLPSLTTLKAQIEFLPYRSCCRRSPLRPMTYRAGGWSQLLANCRRRNNLARIQVGRAHRIRQPQKPPQVMAVTPNPIGSLWRPCSRNGRRFSERLYISRAALADRIIVMLNGWR